jgi:hypothetical protein
LILSRVNVPIRIIIVWRVLMIMDIGGGSRGLGLR